MEFIYSLLWETLVVEQIFWLICPKNWVKGWQHRCALIFTTCILLQIIRIISKPKMSNLMKGKVYGLSLPKAKMPTAATGQPSRVAPLSNSLMNKKPSIFNQSDSDSDNSGNFYIKLRLSQERDSLHRYPIH
jgi:hypothetical protein